MPLPTRHESDAAVDHGLLAGAVVDPAHAHEARERASARRHRQRIAATAIAFVLFAGLAAIVAQVGISGTNGAAAGAAPKVALTAEAVGVLVLRPGTDAERLAQARPVVGAAANQQGSHASYALEGIALVERTTTDASVAVGTRAATAAATVESISLLGGRVLITDAALTATASSAEGHAAGTLELAPATKLVVDGVERPATLNQRIAIEGVGTVIVNEQAVVANVPAGDTQTGPRYRTVGAIAHLRITQDQPGGLAKGSELVIGRVDAGVREGKVRKVAHPGPGAVTPPVAPPAGAPSALQPGTPRPGESVLPRRPSAVRGNAGGVSGAGLSNYLFPVLGTTGYTNDWGAPRASTGIPHQGTDIFAEEGTPIVAVADGVLDRVGWNSIGGYRYWLFDQYGNSFYHAHLSAYSPIAVDGARVRRGDVIGFVGHTGDAQYTPPHLHFEVHPGNGSATNPYPLLNAWQRGVAVAIGLVTSGSERVAPLALLGFSDIGANSGLQDSVLDTVPDTRERSIEQETAPRPTDESLKGAIEGPATSAK